MAGTVLSASPSTPLFADALHEPGDRTALIDPSGREYSYAELCTRSDDFAQQLGSTRQLVFIEATPTIATITAYLGALRHRHPVHLLDPTRPHFNSALIDRYAPNRVVTSHGTDWHVSVHNDRETTLHDDLCLLLATSGSTGSPRLVKLSHANIQSNTLAIIQYLNLTAADRAISSLKLHYSYGLSILNTHLAAGGSFILTDKSVADSAFWHTFKQHGVTSFSGVPYTFELLEQSGHHLHDLPTLRYVTQAGGKMHPARVRALAATAQREGWQLYVMYGQAEASPRIAYLPPHLAIDHPDCIGVPIPGGQISLLDEAGNTIDQPHTPGELIYRGPNVMIGYAQNAADLATSQTLPQLATGDLAVRNALGLYRIVGRKHRHIKPFGIRLNLDDVESHVASLGIPCAVGGDDQGIAVAITAHADRVHSLQRDLAARYALPNHFISVGHVAELPRLPSGKVNYAILPDFVRDGVPNDAGFSKPRLQAPHALRRFAALFFDEFKRILSLRQRWSSVREIFQLSLRPTSLSNDDTFMTLQGDSLSYVQLTLALEEYLGLLPERWEHLTIAQLQRLRPPDLI